MKYFKLNIGDVVIVNERLFKVFLNRGHNGTCEFFTPNLKLVRMKKLQQYVIDNITVNKIQTEINKVELIKEDYPIDETKIQKKEIFKDENKNNK